MSIEALEKVNIFAGRKNRKAILEMIQTKGMVEVSVCKTDEFFHAEDMSQPLMQFDKQLALLSSAIQIFQERSPEKKPFYQDRTLIDPSDLRQVRQENSRYFENAKRAVALTQEIAGCKAEISSLSVKLLGLKPWLPLDCPLSFTGTKKSAAFIGSLQGKWSETQLLVTIGESTPAPVYVEILSQSTDQTCFFAVTHISNEDNLLKVLSEMGFAKASMDKQEETPLQITKQTEEKIKNLEEYIAKCEAELLKLHEDRFGIEILYDLVSTRKEKYEVIQQLAHSKKTFVLTGYMPKSQVEDLTNLLNERFSAHLTVDTLADGEELPVKLKNNFFTKPIEPIVESFSIPSAQDIDPTAITAIFYYFYFGMMFSDAGYGLMVMIFCGAFGFFVKNVKPELKNSMQMFFFCGVSTFLWGILYGSFFGNAISVISNKFFNMNLELKPILFDPVKDPLRLLILSVALGVIHILAGYFMKFITLWRSGKKYDAICDGGFWLLLLTGICVMAVWVGAGAEFLRIPSLTLMAAGTAGVILTAGRSNKNVILRLFSGIISLYDLTGFLSDALSYSRLMALGLATGVIATVANTMSSLFGSGIVGGILFWIVFIAFHLINFGINMLGAYVHTNRLQYVEFFSKFYEGGGRKFSPFSRKYKYTKLEESVNS